MNDLSLAERQRLELLARRVARGWYAPPNDQDDMIQICRIAGARALADHEAPSNNLVVSYMRGALRDAWQRSRRKKRIPPQALCALSPLLTMRLADIPTDEPVCDRPQNKGHRWEKAEDNWLKRYYPILRVRACARHLRRTERAVYERASRLLYREGEYAPY